MSPNGVYRFNTAELKETISHGGRGEIRAARVIARPLGSPCRFVDLAEIPSGATIGLHTHTLEDEEIYVVVEGEGEMVIDGSRVPIGPGDVIVNRPGGAHSLENNGPSPIRIVVIDVRAQL